MYHVSYSFWSERAFDLPALFRQIAKTHPAGFTCTFTGGPDPIHFDSWADAADAADGFDFELVSEAMISGPEVHYAMSFWSNAEAEADGDPKASCITLICVEPMRLNAQAFMEKIDAIAMTWQQAMEILGYPYEDESSFNYEAYQGRKK
jgi:hypothetical protein